MARPEQLLDPDDASSGIRIRRLTAPTRQLLVTSERETNGRMLKKSLNKLDLCKVERCDALCDDKKQFIATLTNVEGEKLLVSEIDSYLHYQRKYVPELSKPVHFSRVILAKHCKLERLELLHREQSL